MAQTYTFNNNHLDYPLPTIFKALKDYCRKPENPFHIESDFIDERGFTIDLSRSTSFVSGETRCKIHVSAYSSEDLNSCDLSFSVQTNEKDEDEMREITCNRILRGIEREIEGKTVEQMLAESAAQGSHNMKDLIGEGKDKRNFIIAILIIAVAIAIMLPSGIAQGCLL